jgi:hypothetical protein
VAEGTGAAGDVEALAAGGDLDGLDAEHLARAQGRQRRGAVDREVRARDQHPALDNVVSTRVVSPRRSLAVKEVPCRPIA